ncbi:bifunctional folylpolyglutamate synthase/dihydrofolate synthase [Candidatus Acetatifactor stercoripullorum]|nr:folylpolyglutamate synthase/dihydrofolate synthase family protein [Candidatus Acetatifactor stercoripullorum]
MEKKQINTFEQAEAYLYDTPRFTRKNTLEDTKAFLKRLGSPDRGMRIIHVAGTNGKGSVCAYLRCILEEAGYTVAAFTSPHLVDIRERFFIKGRMIEKETFLWAFLSVYNALDWEALEKGAGYHPTFFEYLFFMAMLAFSREKPDFCILETGLGGRLDATNAVDEKELSVITRIGLDHVEYLGNTIEAIAGEKAGILKKGTPVVFSDTVKEASLVIQGRAAQLGIQAYPVSKNDYAFLKIKNKSIDFSLGTRYYGYVRLTLHTIAGYQMENAALAVRCAEVLDGGKTISREHLIRGIEKCFWAGRMEEVLPEVYLDGAHNEDGIRAFLDTVKMDGWQGKRSLLFSVAADKDYGHMLQRVVQSGLFDRIAAAHMKNKRAVQLAALDRLFLRYPGCRYTLYDNVDTAFCALLEEQRKSRGQIGEERIYIAGSLYLAGEIKELLAHD